MHTSSTRNNAVHDFTLMKLIVARFLGTGFYIRYFNNHTKVLITKMDPRIPWELVVDPSGRDQLSVLLQSLVYRVHDILCLGLRRMRDDT
jgi:hypothetical protein